VAAMLVFFFVVSLFGFRVATVLYSFVRKAHGLHFKMQFVWHMIFFIDTSLSLSLSLAILLSFSLGTGTQITAIYL